MIVGALGGVVFSVSSRTLKTISNFIWSGSARYATHDLHAGNSISEYTGTDLALTRCPRFGGCSIWNGRA